MILPSVGKESRIEKTHRSTQLFLYCSGGERRVKCVRTAMEIKASKEEQRGVVSFFVAEGAAACHKVKTPWNAVGRNHPFHYNARPHTANLVRDTLQIVDWETLQHPPYSPDLSPCDIHIFGDLKKTSWTSVSFGRGSARVGEVMDPSGTYLFLHDWN